MSKKPELKLGVNETEDGDLFLCKTGAVLHLGKPNAFALDHLDRRMEQEKPEIPMVWIEEKQRDEENEGDPDYELAIKAHNGRYALEQIRIILGTAITVVSVPEGMAGPDDPAWLENLEFLGVPAAPGGFGRIADWCQYYATKFDESLVIYMQVIRKLGVAEEEVTAAVASFLSDSERPPDNGSGTTPRSPNGRPVRSTGRPARTPVRGTRSR